MSKRLLRRVGLTTQRRFRLFLRFCALLLGLSAALCVEIQVQENQYYTALIPFLLVAAAAVLEFVFADVLADQQFPYATEKKFALMERRLGVNAINFITERLRQAISNFRACDTSRIKATVHVLTELEPTAQHPIRRGLLQLTDYVGPDGSGKGRVTLINQGVIGRCARTGKMETVDFASGEEYFESMVRDFSFTSEEAARHTSTGRSYLAWPLVNDNVLIGVLYFFTTEPQVFPHACDEQALDSLGQEVVRMLVLADLV